MPSSGKYTGQKAAARKRAVNWESNPPRCASCIHYRPCVYAQPLMGMPYRPRRCDKWKFETHAQALCDDWVDKKGTTLDNQHETATHFDA